jgi:hypothetical protein
VTRQRNEQEMTGALVSRFDRATCRARNEKRRPWATRGGEHTTPERRAAPTSSCLRDSDQFVGATTGEPQPNFAVAFELAVP